MNESDVINDTDWEVIDCTGDVPYSTDLIKNQTKTGLIIIICNWICIAFILALYAVEIAFIVKNFQTSFRKRNTICVLGLAPVYAVCAIIGVMIPRAGLLVDLAANSYFGLAIYCLMGLLCDYLGEEQLIHADVEHVKLNTFPLCCCFVCLPKPKFDMKMHIILMAMVYQVTLIRPIVAFLSAILWADGQYTPGLITGDNAFIYLILINLVSTLIAIWGLVITQTAFREILAKYLMGLKFLFLQLTLLGTTLGNIVIASLVSRGVIPCAKFIPSGARAARIDNCYVVFWMTLVSLVGLLAFRRLQDGIVDKSAAYKKRQSIT